MWTDRAGYGPYPERATLAGWEFHRREQSWRTEVFIGESRGGKCSLLSYSIPVTHEMTKHVLLCPAKPSSEQRSFLYFFNEGSGVHTRKDARHEFPGYGIDGRTVWKGGKAVSVHRDEQRRYNAVCEQMERLLIASVKTIWYNAPCDGIDGALTLGSSGCPGAEERRCRRFERVLMSGLKSVAWYSARDG